MDAVVANQGKPDDIDSFAKAFNFDPEVFDPLCQTISFLLRFNPQAKVLISVQERSENWTIEDSFKKWNLRGRYVYPEEFLAGTGIDESDLTGRHTIFIVEIFPANHSECNVPDLYQE